MSRMALTADGRITKCTAPDDKIGLGRCNHISHQMGKETFEDFVGRVNRMENPPEARELFDKGSNLEGVYDNRISYFGRSLLHLRKKNGMEIPEDVSIMDLSKYYENLEVIRIDPEKFENGRNDYGYKISGQLNLDVSVIDPWEFNPNSNFDSITIRDKHGIMYGLKRTDSVLDDKYKEVKKCLYVGDSGEEYIGDIRKIFKSLKENPDVGYITDITDEDEVMDYLDEKIGNASSDSYGTYLIDANDKTMVHAFFKDFIDRSLAFNDDGDFSKDEIPDKYRDFLEEELRSHGKLID